VKDLPALLDAAKPVVLALNRLDITYALCGGLAVAAHGHIRATRDIDILLATVTALEEVDPALAPLGWINVSSPIQFEDGFVLHRRIQPVGQDVAVLDLLIQPVGLDFLHDRDLSELDGAACYVVGRVSLLHMKRLAGRAQDLADIENLGGDTDGG
jgi:hypothetical protein